MLTLKERLNCKNPKNRDECISELLHDYFTSYQLKTRIEENSALASELGRGYADGL